MLKMELKTTCAHKHVTTFSSLIVIKFIAQRLHWKFHCFKARSHCAFFPIANAIHLIATNGLYRTQWKCSHCATATTSPAPIQPFVRKNKSQLQIAQCERTLKVDECIVVVLISRDTESFGSQSCSSSA